MINNLVVLAITRRIPDTLVVPSGLPQENEVIARTEDVMTENDQALTESAPERGIAKGTANGTGTGIDDVVNGTMTVTGAIGIVKEAKVDIAVTVMIETKRIAEENESTTTK